jgi:hypothetical protein
MKKAPQKEIDKRINVEYRYKLNEIYEEIKHPFELNLIDTLIKNGIIPADKLYGITPEFEDPKKWRIKVNVVNLYHQNTASTEEVKVKQMKGLLRLTYATAPLDPPFEFEYEVTSNNLLCNSNKIKEIIKFQKEKAEWVKISMGTTNKELTVYDKEKEIKITEFKEQTYPALSQLGFSENESNLMTLTAIKHNSFNADMSLEQFIGLALRCK